MKRGSGLSSPRSENRQIPSQHYIPRHKNEYEDKPEYVPKSQQPIGPMYKPKKQPQYRKKQSGDKNIGSLPQSLNEEHSAKDNNVEARKEDEWVNNTTKKEVEEHNFVSAWVDFDIE